MIGRIQEQKFSQSLVSAALSFSTGFGEAGNIKAIYFSASTNITETITITRVSANGTNYDFLLKTINLIGEKYASYYPDGQLFIGKGDSIKVQCTKANSTGTIYGLIHFEGGING